jgi:hypothetical protein
MTDKDDQGAGLAAVGSDTTVVPASQLSHAEVLAMIDRAYEELCEATKRQLGRRSETRTFRISIPARPDYDTDLIIAKALIEARKLITIRQPSHRKG